MFLSRYYEVRKREKMLEIFLIGLLACLLIFELVLIY